jgi:hypothetical protein
MHKTIGPFMSFPPEPRAIGNKAKFERICVVQQMHTSFDPAQVFSRAFAVSCELRPGLRGA